jgi:glycosyltransferase involved in cell wall biosynthesis
MLNELVLTIITPVYNGEKYISETIESIISAKIDITYEYLVINDGSTDSTSLILDRYKDKVKILTQQNLGESAAVNTGLTHSRGDFVLVVNADDPFLTADLINKGIKILFADPSIVAIYPDWKIISDDKKTKKIIILPEYADEIMIGCCRCLPGPGTLFRKDTALKIGGRSTNWKFVSDYDFWLRMSRQGVIVRLPGVLAQWRESLSSTSYSQRGKLMAVERIKVMEKFILENKISVPLQRKALGNSHYLAARLAFFDSTIAGRKLLFQAFKNRRGWPEEAKLHIVIYLLLLPLSSYIVYKFPKLVKRIVDG